MKAADEISENFPWLGEFKLIHGRLPRVLHIGNIANNAYNNAKILNECGLENDVICYDYYHIMGTPEWEDADFVVNKIDQFNPNWSAIDLNGFQRPKWFAQGPLELCLKYFLHKYRGNEKDQIKIWVDLCVFNQTDSGKKSFKLLSGFKKYLFKTKSLLTANREDLDIRVNFFINGLKPSSLNFYIYFFYLLFALPLFFTITIFKYVVKIFYDRDCIYSKANILINGLKPSSLNFYIYFFYLLFALPLFFTITLFKYAFRILSSSNKIKIREEINYQKIMDQLKSSSLKDLSFYQLNQDWLQKDVRKSVDIGNFNKWSELFLNYDIVIGYSTDGIYPLLANTPYIAFEHGTIREIPYQATSQGRLCAATYSSANCVFVTNFDCKKSAELLAPNRYILINHPFDEDHSHGIVEVDSLRNILLQELDSDFLFFFPTRHDWVKGTGYADKANDVFIKAFIRLRQLGFRIGMVCCEWGQNVKNSKKLLSNSGVDNYVKWSDPMATVQFERTAMACDCVVDQFKLGSFGGVLFKAMAAGSPVMTYLNEEMLKEQFSEMPPVINCKNETDIIDATKSFYDKPDLKEELGQKSRDWINRHHSKRDTINKQLEQFKLLLQHKLTRNANDA